MSAETKRARREEEEGYDPPASSDLSSHELEQVAALLRQFRNPVKEAKQSVLLTKPFHSLQPKERAAVTVKDLSDRRALEYLTLKHKELRSMYRASLAVIDELKVFGGDSAALAAYYVRQSRRSPDEKEDNIARKALELKMTVMRIATPTTLATLPDRFRKEAEEKEKEIREASRTRQRYESHAQRPPIDAVRTVPAPVLRLAVVGGEASAGTVQEILNTGIERYLSEFSENKQPIKTVYGSLPVVVKQLHHTQLWDAYWNTPDFQPLELRQFVTPLNLPIFNTAPLGDYRFTTEGVTPIENLLTYQNTVENIVKTRELFSQGPPSGVFATTHQGEKQPIHGFVINARMLEKILVRGRRLKTVSTVVQLIDVEVLDAAFNRPQNMYKFCHYAFNSMEIDGLTPRHVLENIPAVYRIFVENVRTAADSMERKQAVDFLIEQLVELDYRRYNMNDATSLDMLGKLARMTLYQRCLALRDELQGLRETIANNTVRVQREVKLCQEFVDAHTKRLIPEEWKDGIMTLFHPDIKETVDVIRIFRFLFIDGAPDSIKPFTEALLVRYKASLNRTPLETKYRIFVHPRVHFMTGADLRAPPANNTLEERMREQLRALQSLHVYSDAAWVGFHPVLWFLSAGLGGSEFWRQRFWIAEIQNEGHNSFEQSMNYEKVSLLYFAFSMSNNPDYRPFGQVDADGKYHRMQPLSLNKLNQTGNWDFRRWLIRQSLGVESSDEITSINLLHESWDPRTGPRSVAQSIANKHPEKKEVDVRLALGSGKLELKESKLNADKGFVQLPFHSPTANILQTIKQMTAGQAKPRSQSCACGKSIVYKCKRCKEGFCAVDCWSVRVHETVCVA